jgi:hypothetical protein
VVRAGVGVPERDDRVRGHIVGLAAGCLIAAVASLL